MLRKQLDILAVGDITTDAFIRLKDPHVHAEINHESRELCMGFGEKIPFEYVKVVKSVGNAANAAVCGARLGLRTSLITVVGDDENGRDSIVELRKNGVGTDFIRTEKFKATNYHFVLWFDQDRTILVNHATFDYRVPAALSKNSGFGLPPKWLYLTSLASNSFPFEMEIADYLEANPGIRLAFQPGTFQIKLGREKQKRIYSRADLVIVNLQEAQRIINGTAEADHAYGEVKEVTEPTKLEVKEMLRGLHSLGPKLIAITDGTAGSYLFDGDHYYHMPIFPDPHPAFERTGCGDAWAGTFVASLAKGKTPLEALALAPVNAMSVSQFVGPQEGLLTSEQIEWWLTQAPDGYRPREI